ncbi:MAG: cupin domain-containing protein [Actinomycetota bacterium]
MVVSASELDFRSLEGRSSADPFRSLDADGLSMRVVHLAAGATRKPHRHPHSCEAMYVVEGSGHFWEHGRAHRVEQGDCILVAPGVPHATIPDRGEDMKLVCFLPHPDLTSNIEELNEEIEVEVPGNREPGG